MIVLALKSIRSNLAINIYSILINTLIFSVVLLMYGWIDEMYFSTGSDALIFLKIVVSLFLLTLMFSMYYITVFMLNKRKKEFSTYLICGATNNYIFACKIVHILIVILLSELLGSVLFVFLQSVLRITVGMDKLVYVFIIYVVLYLAETSIIHFRDIKETNVK